LNVAQEHTSLHVKEIFTGWIKFGGHPLLNVSKAEDDTSITYKITQEVCKRDMSVEIRNAWLDEHGNCSYQIPLFYKTKNSENAKLEIIKSNTHTFTVEKKGKDDFVILNWDRIAFVRMNYEKEEWMNLAHLISTKRIPPREQLSLLIDVTHTVSPILTPFVRSSTHTTPIQQKSTGERFSHSSMPLENQRMLGRRKSSVLRFL